MNDDRTALIGGTAVSPGMQTASADSSESCPSCQNTIPPGEQFCPRCGYQRGTWRQAAAPSTTAAATTVAGQSNASAAASSGPALWRITSAAGASFDIPAGETLIGRGDVAVKVDDGFVSRQHARLDASPDTLTLTDLGSSNGTFVDERRLNAAETVTLNAGQQFRVAHTTFTLEQVAAPAGDQTVVAPVPEAAEPQAEQTQQQSGS
jgi:pSer/pThr/pTyr-binding forkhead associated (FHA) protein